MQTKPLAGGRAADLLEQSMLLKEATVILALGAVRIILQSPNHLHHMPLIQQKLQHTCSRAET